MNASFRPQRRARQAGFSLIELMISLVIGMVVVGAVMAAYLGAGNSSRTSRAMAQITEDASIAMNVMRSSVAMVGYGKPTGVNGVTGKFKKAYGGLGVFGCDASFTNPSDAIGSLTCGGAGSDAIAVAYEADKDNSIVSGVKPLDCLGNPIDLDISGTYYLAYNRFYMTGSQLMCYGSGSKAAQPLVDNVADMQVRYGVATTKNPNQVAAYKTAKSLQDDFGSPDGWDRVVSVRICMVVKSADNVLDAPVTYEGCGGQVTPGSADRHMYRTFTTTVVLQNRLGSMR